MRLCFFLLFLECRGPGPRSFSPRNPPPPLRPCGGRGVARSAHGLGHLRPVTVWVDHTWVLRGVAPLCPCLGLLAPFSRRGLSCLTSGRVFHVCVGSGRRDGKGCRNQGNGIPPLWEKAENLPRVAAIPVCAFLSGQPQRDGNLHRELGFGDISAQQPQHCIRAYAPLRGRPGPHACGDTFGSCCWRQAVTAL